MTISEPTTLATDWLLAALATGFALRLPAGEGDRRRLAARLWRMAFSLLAASSFAGGAVHGFALVFSETLLAVLWKATVLGLGSTTALLLAGAVVLGLGARSSRLALGAVTLELLVYAAWMLRHDAYLGVVVQSLVCFAAMLAVAERAWRKGEAGAGSIVVGVLVSILAGAVQAAGPDLHRHFNANDLYHVIQMVGLVFFYRGASVWGRNGSRAGSGSGALPAPR